MEANIKCFECEKITRNLELGKLFYLKDNPSKSLIVKDKIICPKCKKDISDNKCIVKSNELLMKFITANLSISSGSVPNYLKGAYPLMEQDYYLIQKKCFSKLRLVKRF